MTQKLMETRGPTRYNQTREYILKKKEKQFRVCIIVLGFITEIQTVSGKNIIVYVMEICTKKS